MADVKIKAQVMIEFIVSFSCLLWLLVLTTQVFGWFGETLVRRHLAYEGSRTVTHDANNKVILPPVDFYVPLNTFKFFNDSE